MTAREARAAARRGAKFLDEHLGRGWWRKIKLRRLDMRHGSFTENASGCGCIIAQLYGNYGVGTDELGLTDDAEGSLGFVLPDAAFESMLDAALAWERLTAAWKKELAR